MHTELNTPPPRLAATGAPAYRCESLTPDHLDAVVTVSEAVWEHLQTNGHSDFALRRTRAELESYLTSGCGVGILSGEQVVGFGYLGRTSAQTPDDGAPGMKTIYDPTKTGVLRTAIVHPLHQRKGLGLTLVVERITLAQRLGCTSVVTGASSPNTASWHNLLRAGMRLAQVGDLPASISPNSSLKAFYFHKNLSTSLGTIPESSFAAHTVIDPVEDHALVRKLLEAGQKNTGYKMDGKKMLLILSQPTQ